MATAASFICFDASTVPASLSREKPKAPDATRQHRNNDIDIDIDDDDDDGGRAGMSGGSSE
jgi:hypothetical protein